jgi:hypothetical protein
MWAGLGYYRRARFLFEVILPSFANISPALCCFVVKQLILSDDSSSFGLDSASYSSLLLLSLL